MPKYYLVAENAITGKQKVLMEKKSILEMDNTIFNQFQSDDEIKKFYGLMKDYNLDIRYNHSGINHIDVIVRNKFTKEFGIVLEYVNGGLINYGLSFYTYYVENLVKTITEDKALFLRNYGYIDSKMFCILLDYLDLARYLTPNKNDVMEDAKQVLRRYLKFRNAYIGSYNYDHHITKDKIKSDINKKISTEDSLLNNLFNDKFDRDDVYSVYDLDDLSRIDNCEQLNIDGLKRR